MLCFSKLEKKLKKMKFIDQYIQNSQSFIAWTTPVFSQRYTKGQHHKARPRLHYFLGERKPSNKGEYLLLTRTSNYNEFSCPITQSCKSHNPGHFLAQEKGYSLDKYFIFIDQQDLLIKEYYEDIHGKNHPCVWSVSKDLHTKFNNHKESFYRDDYP